MFVLSLKLYFEYLSIVFVLGAGQGPLVHCTIRATRTICNDYCSIFRPKIVAVEKNPKALDFLYMNRRDWSIIYNVYFDIVHEDMRRYQPIEKADMVISELLGGFGCNELSPECLDASTHLMKGEFYEFCIKVVLFRLFLVNIIVLYFQRNVLYSRLPTQTFLHRSIRRRPLW